MLPGLAAKICGVKNRDAEAYWKMIRKMCTQETLVVTHPGWFQKGDAFMGETPRMIANGRIDKRKVKESKLYPYGILRDEVQDYILEKTEQLIRKKMIRGTFERGMEYRILAVALDLNKEAVRMIQQFDSTRRIRNSLCLLSMKKYFQQKTVSEWRSFP